MNNFMRAVALGASVLVTGAAHAALAFDQNVTPGVIFGNGNANGGFTVATNGGVELGLRAKLRHDPANGGAPQNIFNSNGDGSYSFAAGAWTGSGGGPTTAYWSVEFSINTNTSGTNGLQLDDLTYEFGRDTDPTAAGQSYLTGDPINVAFADHGMGDNTTVQCNGTNSNPGCHDTRNMSTSPADYVADIAVYNVAQNSAKAHWLLGGGFNPTVDGTYDFYLTAYRGTGQNRTLVASTNISVIVGDGNRVPTPGTLALTGLALAGLAAGARWRKA